MELFHGIMFRKDNTEDCYSDAMLAIFNRELAARIAHLEDAETDAAYQIAKTLADEVNNRPGMFDNPAQLQSRLPVPSQEG